MLVEREGTLAVLRDAVQHGARHVLIAGEAGSGKTSVVRAFLRDLEGVWVLGSCDSLRTARPLGPFLDWPGEVEAVLSRVAVAVGRALTPTTAAG